MLVAQGKLDEALKAYRDGLAVAERLAASDRGNVQWQRDLAVSYVKVGDVLVAQGKLDEALKSLPRRPRHPRAPRRRRSGKAQWQRDLSVAYNKIGDVLVAQGKLDEALKAYRDDLAIAERLAAADRSNTQWQRDLSVCVQQDRRRAGGAGQARRGAQGLPRQPRHRGAPRRRRSRQCANGSAIWRCRTTRSATCCWRRASSTRRSRPTATASPSAERLAAADRSNSRMAARSVGVYSKIGDVLVAQGKLDEALKAYRDGLAIAERLAAADPSNAQWQRDLSVSYERIGDVLVAQGKLDEALKAYRDSLAIRERLAAADRSNTQWQRDLSVSYEQDRRRAGGAGQARRGAQGLPRQPRHPRAPRRGRSAATREWQRDLSVSYDKVGDVLVTQGKLDEALQGLPDEPRHPRAPGGRRSAAIRGGSATCRCPTTRSATCWWRRASSTRRSKPTATPRHPRAPGRRRSQQCAMAARSAILIGRIGTLSYRFALAGDFAKAIAVADEVIALAPEKIWLYTNRAHALMFVGRIEEARAVYLKYRGTKNVEGGKSWEAVILEDFVELRKARLVHTLMDEIEKLFTARG